MTFIFIALASATLCAEEKSRLDYEACLGREQQDAEFELNKQWRKTLGQMRRHDALQKGQSNAGAGDALLAAQRAWLKYRELNCEAVAAPLRGFAGEPEAQVECMIRMTRRRTEFLKGRKSSYPKMLEAL